jgi:hypothetical protein
MEAGLLLRILLVPQTTSPVPPVLPVHLPVTVVSQHAVSVVALIDAAVAFKLCPPGHTIPAHVLSQHVVAVMPEMEAELVFKMEFLLQTTSRLLSAFPVHLRVGGVTHTSEVSQHNETEAPLIWAALLLRCFPVPHDE